MKKSLLFTPFYDISGYSGLGRKLFKNLITEDIYVKIYPLFWVLPTFLDIKIDKKYIFDENERNKIQNKNIFDSCIFLTLPIEYGRYFTEVAKKKIGYTTLECFPWLRRWVNGCNLMDELWVLSEYDKLNALTSGVNKPIKIVVPKNMFKKSKIGKIKKKRDEEFTFLFVGQMTKGDRKNIEKLILFFIEIFKNKKYTLILKTYMHDCSYIDFVETEKVIKRICANKPKFPTIKLYHGIMTEEKISELYSNVDVFVTLSHGEGFCVPLLQAVNEGIPIIAPGFSGYMTYLNKDFSLFLDYKMSNVNLNISDIYSNGQVWCDVLYDNVEDNFKKIINGYNKYKNMASKQKEYMIEKLKEYELKKDFLSTTSP